jgi:hypothetical protein
MIQESQLLPYNLLQKANFEMKKNGGRNFENFSAGHFRKRR